MATATVSSRADEILKELAAYGNESTKRIFARHGAREPFFGVKVADLKKIQKRVKKDYQLALDLYATGNSDAMYLAALIADDARMTRPDLERWVKAAYWHMLSDYAVAWVAAGSPAGLDAALDWIDSREENVACSGWSTLSSIAGITPDDKLDLPLFRKLLSRIKKEIARQPPRVQGAMNSFILAAGTFSKPLFSDALETGKAIGRLSAGVDGSCSVHYAPDYLAKVQKAGRVGKKRKTAKC